MNNSYIMRLFSQANRDAGYRSRMRGSEILMLFSEANRRSGYTEYANILEDSASVHEATEILREERKDERQQSNMGE